MLIFKERSATNSSWVWVDEADMKNKVKKLEEENRALKEVVVGLDHRLSELERKPGLTNFV